MSISRSLVNHVLGQKKRCSAKTPAMTRTFPPVRRSPISRSARSCASRSCPPDNQPLGILQLDTSDRKQFHQDDLDVLAAVASQAAVAIQNASMHESLLERERIDRDLKLAEQVQKRFLPQSVPTLPGFEFFAHYHPAFDVGGDYYDFVTLSPEAVSPWRLGDVSGKGVAAALMMAKFSGDTRYCILTEPTARRGRHDCSTACSSEPRIDEKFITLSLSVLDLERRPLTYCSAGHPPLLVRRASGTIEELGDDITGFPLGIMPDTDYQQAESTLEPGRRRRRSTPTA